MQDISIGNIKLGERPLVAVPLTDKSLEADLSAADADLIEIRVDMFSDLSKGYVIDHINKIKDKFGKPVITTIRWYHEGGAVEMEEKERNKLYKEIAEYTDAIDVEISSDVFGGALKAGRKKKKPVIASFHDFTGTPDLSTLSNLVKKAKSFKADIVKVAVMPRDAGDLRTITRFTLDHYDDAIIAIAMGELGMISRAFLPMIGSLITFASLDTVTAPGQMSLAEMKKFLSVMDHDYEAL